VPDIGRGRGQKPGSNAVALYQRLQPFPDFINFQRPKVRLDIVKYGTVQSHACTIPGRPAQGASAHILGKGSDLRMDAYAAYLMLIRVLIEHPSNGALAKKSPRASDSSGGIVDPVGSVPSQVPGCSATHCTRSEFLVGQS